MHTVGVIAEYNPFHTGHSYHLEKAKEISGADYAVVVMSPDFVQRGEPAIFDKYTRTRMALQNGADLVIELPVCYATGSAEYFAQGAVALLDRLGITDTLCFGGESDDTGLFYRTAGILLSEPDAYAQELRRLLKEGKTYPQARSRALAEYFSQETSGCPAHEFQEFLSTPNNILGIEYCKALLSMNSRISALSLRRNGSGYGSLALEGSYCSATALRGGILEGCSEKSLFRYIPGNCRELFRKAAENPRTPEELTSCLMEKLLSEDSYDHILDITPELSDRIRSLRFFCIGKSFDETVALLKTKQITEARIRRALLHLILGIRTDTVESFRSRGTVYYAKALGFRRETAPLLHSLKEKSSLPFITKNARALDILQGPGRQMWEMDLFASHLYRGLAANQSHTPFRSEYEISPVII
ncbi:MAG: nucleotidyltransferase family protein [Lachnospiraceae bacterium]|nr:nucleotidyltransferase family protein [Lachnospiraceae bacterium]